MVGTSPLPSPSSSPLPSPLNTSSSQIPNSNPIKVKKRVKKKASTTKDGKKRRSYQVKHVHVALDIKLELSLVIGFVELTVAPTSTRKLSHIKIHARHLNVTKITVEGIIANYEYKNYVNSPVDLSSNIREIKTYNVFHKAALESNDDGNLYITIPPEFDSTKQSTFKVKVEYNITKTNGGIHFACEKMPKKRMFNLLSVNETKPLAPPHHIFTHNQVQGARFWIPSLDNNSNLSTWSFEYRAPSYYTVVSSGELIATRMEQIPFHYYQNHHNNNFANDDQMMIIESENNNNNIIDDQNQNQNQNQNLVELKTSYFELNIPTLAQNIAMACGPFEIYPDPSNQDITHFCLPGLMPKLSNTIQFFHKAVQLCEEYLGVPFPYGSYKHVFVDEAYTKISSYASLSICSSELIHDHQIIDQTYTTRKLLIIALTQQWFGNLIGFKSWSDSWLRFGLNAFLQFKVLRELLGNNEMIYQSIKDFEVVTKLDIENRAPLHWHSYLHAIQFYDKLFFKKASIVFTMIERKLGAEVFQNLISKLVTIPEKDPESFDRILSTRQFMKMIQKVTVGPDMKAFERQWISGRGCPSMLCGFFYNKKRQQTEFAMRQTLPSKDRFAGSLTVRINELDGTYDHVIQFDDEWHGFDFPCYSRLRKNRKKKIKYANGEEVEVDLTRRENPLLWIRIDPQFDWGPLVKFKQPEYMWILQLEMDRDVISQYFAIQDIASTPSYNVTSALVDVLSNAKSKYFYKIRMEAAYALAICANTETELISMDKLLAYFKSQFYDYQMTLLKPNNFSDFSLYFIKMAVQWAISTVKDKDGNTPQDVLTFLLDLLKNNDNTYNDYSDYRYLSTIIKSLRNVKTENKSFLQKLLKQIDRFLNIEKLMPSYHLEITASCLKSLCYFQYSKQANLNLEIFENYSEYGNPVNVRSQAYKSILLLSLNFLVDQNYYKYLSLYFDLMKDQTDIPRLKYKVTKGFHRLVEKKRIRNDRFKEKTSLNQQFCDQLWFFLNGEETAYDARLRWAVLSLYKSIWSSELPACYPSDYKDHTLDELRKNVEFLAPSKKSSSSLLSSSSSLSNSNVTGKRKLSLSLSSNSSPSSPSSENIGEPKVRLVVPNSTPKRRKVSNSAESKVSNSPLNSPAPSPSIYDSSPNIMDESTTEVTRVTKSPTKKKKSSRKRDSDDPSFTSKKRVTKKKKTTTTPAPVPTATLPSPQTQEATPTVSEELPPVSEPNNNINNNNDNNTAELPDSKTLSTSTDSTGLKIKFTLK